MQGSGSREPYVIVNMSPLPEAFIKALLAPYLGELDRPVEVVTVTIKDGMERLREALKRADVVIGDYTFATPITAEMCGFMEKVRLIAQPSTGFDHIDVEACARKGIPVANIGGANAVSVAEYTIAAALVLLKRLVKAHLDVSEGRWSQWELMELGTYELHGKTWGIIGLGRIGLEVAKRLKCFGVKILYYDKVRREKEEAELGIEYAPLPRLLKQSDIVSIHVPLTSETRGMIGEKELRLMKPTAILINPSRGEVVDEEALARALSEGWIMGAAVDVYSREPPGPDHPLMRVRNVNLLRTPHIAGATTDARSRIIATTIENVVRVLKGEPPLNVVNM